MASSYASVVLNHPKRGIARVWFRRTMIVSWSSELEPNILVPFNEWDEFENTLRKEGCRIERWSWTAPYITIRDLHPKDGSHTHMAEVVASYYKETLTVQGFGYSPKEAMKHMYNVWNATTRAARKPHDLVLLGSSVGNNKKIRRIL